MGCDFGVTLNHGGGYPGYGSHVLLIPQKGLGVFALTNRTYGGPSGAVWDAAAVLTKAELLQGSNVAVSDDLARAYRAVGAIYKAGNVTRPKTMLAMNFLMDRDAAGWSRDLAKSRRRLGNATRPRPSSHRRHGREFKWRCTHGRVTGSVLLAPTTPRAFSRSSWRFSRADCQRAQAHAPCVRECRVADAAADNSYGTAPWRKA